MSSEYVSDTATPTVNDANARELEPSQANAINTHKRAVQAWLTAPRSERAFHMRAVESAWRNVKQEGVADVAISNAKALASEQGKLRSRR